MKKFKLFLLTYTGGARGDFILGWLGHLDHFRMRKWSLDPFTGRSYANYMGKFLDSVENQHRSIDDYLKDYGILLDGNSKDFIALGCHGRNLQHQLSAINANDITLMRLYFNESKQKEVHWNFLVKTHFTEFISCPDERYDIDHILLERGIVSDSSEITEEIRRTALEEVISKRHNCGYCEMKEYHIPTIDLDYEKVFRPGGSRYLTDRLGLKAHERHHLHWDSMLPLSDAPLEFEKFGKIWRFSDYF